MKGIQKILPSDISVVGHFWGSEFQNDELETIARHIVIYLQQHGDKWDTSFKLEDLYPPDEGRGCDTHWYFSGANYAFVPKGYMTKNEDNGYVVTKKFIRAVIKYLL